MGSMHPDGRNDSDALPARDAWLQSYLDGELGSEERSRVEAWLAENPSARAEADAHRRLDDLFEEDRIEGPSQRSWDRTLGHVAQTLKARPSRFGQKAWPFLWMATAAAVLGAVWLGARLLGPVPPPRPDGPHVEVFAVADSEDIRIDEMDPFDSQSLIVGTVPGGMSDELKRRNPFAVARDDETAIISMEGEDTYSLIVGLPPVIGPLLMALPGEVSVENIETVKGNDPKPYVYPPQGSDGMPMIMVPFRSVRR